MDEEFLSNDSSLRVHQHLSHVTISPAVEAVPFALAFAFAFGLPLCAKTTSVRKRQQGLGSPQWQHDNEQVRLGPVSNHRRGGSGGDPWDGAMVGTSYLDKFWLSTAEWMGQAVSQEGRGVEVSGRGVEVSEGALSSPSRAS